MKKLLALAFVILGIISISGQEKGKFRVGLDLGYVFENDGEMNADSLRQSLQSKCNELENFLSRVHILPELINFNTSDFLEIHFKAYQHQP